MPGFGPPLKLAGTVDDVPVATDVRACETCGAFVIYPSIHADWHRQLRVGVASGVLNEPPGRFARAVGAHSYEQSDPHVDGCDHCGDLRRHHP